MFLIISQPPNNTCVFHVTLEHSCVEEYVYTVYIEHGKIAFKTKNVQQILVDSLSA